MRRAGRWLLIVFLLAFSVDPSLFRAEESGFILKTERLEPYTPTYLGNGYFSMVTSQHGTRPTPSYMAWVFDHGEGDVPRIAALPAWNEINFFNGASWLNDAPPDEKTLRSFQQSLDMRSGYLETSYRWVDGEKSASITARAFVSRSDPNLAALRLDVVPDYSGPVKVSFPLRGWKAPKRLPLGQLERLEPGQGGIANLWYPGHMEVKARHAESDLRGGLLWLVSRAEGRTTAAAQAAAAAWPDELPNLTVRSILSEDSASIEVGFEAEATKQYTFYKYVAIFSSRDAPDPLEEAKKLAQSARARGYDELFNQHAGAWHALWQTDILVEGDAELQRFVRSMIFHLLGSIRQGTEFGMPPMGLSSAGYYGHIFWDADTWIFPALLVMHPEIAKSIVMFRYRTLEAAKLNARLNGYRGAMYPWESDELGQESTPRFAYQNALYENHITGDVALAQWQYYLATADRQWLARYGYPVIRETADFWVSRVTYNRAKDRYEIKKVVSVDESSIGVDNEAYTNAVAKKNLDIARAAGRLLGEKINPAWEEVSRKLYIPYDAQRQYHPEFEGAPPWKGPVGHVVPLLSYPLELPMSEQAKRNDLLNAVKSATEFSAVMMLPTFYPIVAAELGDARLLDELFPKSYRPYLRPPFNVLSEGPTNDAINFLTGAGGFLQQFIYGYTGLRLGEEGLVQRFKPLLPSQIRKLVLKNLSVRGRRLDIAVEGNSLRLTGSRRVLPLPPGTRAFVRDPLQMAVLK